MLTRKLPLLINAQGIQWSQQRIFAAASQICILLISVIVLTNIVITLGERRLQEDWATQRYSELQAVGTLIADKVSFQQFRTQMFATSELLNRYLDLPTEANQENLQNNWDIVVDNIPELLGIALYDPQGQLKFATDEEFGHNALPPSLLGSSRNMGGNEIYTSPLEFSPINGKLEPYLYQLAWLENPDQSVRGYLVAYNSMSRMLKNIKPAYSSKQAPLMMLDTQGLLYSGALDSPTTGRLPETMGGSLKQSYPALWRKMATSNFGQFHGDDATFVYLKVELTTQYETRREYFLLSYVKNDDIAAKFEQWRNILMGGAIFLTLLACVVIYLTHAYRLVHRSRDFSIDLANRLFNTDSGYIIANELGRVLSANTMAAKLLSLEKDELSDRSLQRILHMDDEQYQELETVLAEQKEWRGELDTEASEYTQLSVSLRLEYDMDNKQNYTLVTFEDIGELKHSQEEARLNQLLNDNPMATVLSDAKGVIIKSNAAFNSLMQVKDSRSLQITDLLTKDFKNQWPQISQQLILKRTWQGQILSANNRASDDCMLATLKGHLDASDDIEYIVCTFEHAKLKAHGTEPGSSVPHRSTIFNDRRDLERYFNNMSQEKKDFSSLMLLDIAAEGMLSHMSDIGQLESRQKEVESQLLRELPNRYQMSRWQLGKLIIMLPDTDSDQAHYFAIDTLSKLKSNGLGEGICIGIAAYQGGQVLEQFLSNAEIALKRAKQTDEQNICQAFTRQIF
ncbi:Sensory box protein, putative [Shewanella piezotolerans WP3]|uniref:Sensory box protein, putative n=1 Tax=Shewanella piezotolerans (strain WP3 / JCM 13877) TaxID=225849 RepID=B8CU35_SHEPW|nr:PAS domain-containing protein [Shewanella piezotolerans]ACJ30891.1 Sensory box protein, putative [Shewanella piezotolerans WP3]